MTAVTAEDLARERPYLFGVAYRILGSAADADDVLQEAFLRAQAIDAPRSVRAVLTTIVTRLCLDEVRSARRRREAYVGPWLPEPILTDAAWTTSTAERVEDAESVPLGFLILLEALSPLERAVYVLREVLDHDFAEIAAALERSEPACRQLFHRATAHVRDRRHRFPASAADQAALTASFMNALGRGDLDALAAMFTADVAVTADHGGKAKANLQTIHGPDRTARYLLGLGRKFARHAPGAGDRLVAVTCNGAPALLVFDHAQVTTAVLVDIAGADAAARIVALHVVRNPDKLARLAAAVATGARWP
jgi:RNA polymerase sigma-70 factor (ECF subfamily)